MVGTQVYLFILVNNLAPADTDPHSQYGSRSRRAKSMRIQIHSTGFGYGEIKKGEDYGKSRRFERETAGKIC
jgi:hypothetical protein